MKASNKLRIGLLVDDFIIPYWAYSIVEKIESSEFAEIVLVVKKRKSSVKTIWQKARNSLPVLFYKIFRQLESYFFKVSPYAFERKDLRTLISIAKVFEVDCIEKKYSDYVTEDQVKEIKDFHVDVFIRFGFRILRGEMLKTAKYGIWSYHHGDNAVNRGGPAGFWEVMRREREVGSILQILTEDLDGGHVLARSWSGIHRLLTPTVNAYFWKSSTFILRNLKELYEFGGEAFMEKIRLENDRLNFYSHPLYTIPRNLQFLILVFSNVWNWAKLNCWKLLNFEQWILLYAFDQRGITTSIFKYKRITPPKDRFWADPCVIFDNNKFYIFLEEFIYKEKRGHISVIELNKNGIPGNPKVILEKSYHLSYPFVFKYQDNYYMIPETSENSTIELYQARDFPYKWEFRMNLIENIRAFDTTLLIKDNKFWLFTNLKDIDGASPSEELFLFMSDNLFSNTWEQHPCNPIVSDVKSARPAGRMFYHNGKLYRPSQDCSYKYGYSTVINEVQILNEKEYKEYKISEISPKWAKDVVATHTISFDQDLSVIDASINRKKFT